MIAALYSSREEGSKQFVYNGIEHGWGTVEAVYVLYDCINKIHSLHLIQLNSGTSQTCLGLGVAFLVVSLS